MDSNLPPVSTDPAQTTAETLSRRRFLKGAAASALAASAVAGLSPSALAQAQLPLVANNKRWTAIDFAKTRPAIMAWPSEKAVSAHLKLYEGYVKKVNELTELLEKLPRDPAKANATYSDLREMKVELSFAIGGVKNHEIYFGHLGGAGGAPTGSLAIALKEAFGSFEAWVADLKSTGLGARGWTWLAYDLERRTLVNYIGDAQNTFPIWSAMPILALDMYEHAYWMDYTTGRAAYIDDFLKHIDWSVVQANFDSALRKAGV